MQDVGLDRLAEAAFLDHRLHANTSSAQVVPWRDLPLLPSQPALLFHTAFCGSTLLARALNFSAASVALKEPAVLLSLALADLKGQIDLYSKPCPLQIALGLLGRPWMQGGRVLVKPTNQVNRLLPHFMRLNTRPKLLLYSSLEEFLISCFKKLPEAEKPMQWMAQFLLQGTQLSERLKLPCGFVPNFVEACVLTWYAQMERYADAIDQDVDDRLRSLDMAILLEHSVLAVEASARWLELDGALLNLAARVQDTFSRDSKKDRRAYDVRQRAVEKRNIREHFGPVILKALTWAEHSVKPAARLPTEWKPLLNTGCSANNA